MAKIQEEIIIIKLSKLQKTNTSNSERLTSGDFAANLEDIVQELVGDGVVVEVETGE
jgi:hypothetical protein